MLYSIIGILVIILDQLVKYFVDQNINWTKPVIELIPNVLSLVRVQNDGAAFSFLSGGSARIWFIALTAIFAILVVIALATNFVSGRFGRWCLVFITAGGLSNMIDRIRFGFVIDMFRIDMFDFAVFNVADIFITVFCIAFILYILFGGEKEKEEIDEFDEDEDEDEEDLPPRRVRKTRKAQADRYEDEPEEIKPRRTRRRAAEEEDEYEEAPVRTRTRKEPATATRRNPDTAAYGQNGNARRENPASERRRPEAANEARSVKRQQPRSPAQGQQPNQMMTGYLKKCSVEISRRKNRYRHSDQLLLRPGRALPEIPERKIRLPTGRKPMPGPVLPAVLPITVQQILLIV